jgi:hypothetical protein
MKAMILLCKERIVMELVGKSCQINFFVLEFHLTSYSLLYYFDFLIFNDLIFFDSVIIFQ